MIALHDIGFAVAAIVAVVMVAFVFFKISNSASDPWSFTDMLMTHGHDGKRRADHKAFAFLGAWAASTFWGTWMAVNHELTEWLFNGYMVAWASAGVANAWLKAKQEQAK